MAKTPTYWDKRALRRLDDAEKMSDAYIKRIKRIYAKAYKDIEKDIESVYRNYSKDTGLDVQKLKELLTRSETKKTWEQMKRQGLDKYVKNNYKARISRLEQVQAQIYAKAKLIYDKEELEHTMCYKGVINDSYYKAVYDTQMGTGYAFGFSKIDKNLMDALLSERWSGKNYSERIWGNTDILADSLSDVISSGMLSGQSVSKMTKQIKEPRPEVSEYAPKIIQISIDPEKIGEVVGQKGKTINEIIARTGVKIDISEEGNVSVCGTNLAMIKVISLLNLVIILLSYILTPLVRRSRFMEFVSILLL